MSINSFELTQELEAEVLVFCKEQNLSNVSSSDDLSDFKQSLQNICEELKKKIPYYDWVGFYWSSSTKEKTLELIAYTGDPTDHIEIPYGRGVCGQVAVSKETMIVDDVNQESNYIACSISVKSEIVVPILKDGKFVGQIDIDSHKVKAFDRKDQNLLEKICQIISQKLN